MRRYDGRPFSAAVTRSRLPNCVVFSCSVEGIKRSNASEYSSRRAFGRMNPLYTAEPGSGGVVQLGAYYQRVQYGLHASFTAGWAVVEMWEMTGASNADQGLHLSGWYAAVRCSRGKLRKRRRRSSTSLPIKERSSMTVSCLSDEAPCLHAADSWARIAENAEVECVVHEYLERTMSRIGG